MLARRIGEPGLRMERSSSPLHLHIGRNAPVHVHVSPKVRSQASIWQRSRVAPAQVRSLWSYGSHFCYYRRSVRPVASRVSWRASADLVFYFVLVLGLSTGCSHGLSKLRSVLADLTSTREKAISTRRWSDGHRPLSDATYPFILSPRRLYCGPAL